MPLKKKNKIRNKILFWLAVGVLAALFIYVPKSPNVAAPGEIEYELY